MNRKDKLISRFKTQPSDFTWDELVRLLHQLGFIEGPAGKTAGSRRRFIHETAGVVSLHRPHPDPVVKGYVLRALKQKLEDEKLI